MVRAILAAVGGYVFMVMIVMTGIAAVWFSMGNQFAFDGESNRASMKWTLAMLASGLVASIAGGLFASLVGGTKGNSAVRILLGIVLVLGLLSLAAQLVAEPPMMPEGTKVADLTFVEAGTYAVSPMWYNVAIIFVGLGGTCFGGRQVRRQQT